MPSVYTRGIRPEKIDDFVELTLRDFEKDKWTDISTDLQYYSAYDNLLLGDRVSVDGGEQLQWQVKVRNAGSAVNTGMYAVDQVKVVDVMKNAVVPWTKQTANMGYDIDESALNSGDPYRIIDLLKVRRHSALTDFADLLEENFWGMPSNSTDEAELLKPYGVPYWLPRNTTRGFNGTLPLGGGHSSVAGLDPSTYPNWSSYTGSYASISKRDLVRLLRRAMRECHFKQPISQRSPSGAQRPKYCLATTLDVVQKLEELAEEQNTNLGNDLASKDGVVTVRRFDVNWVPYLDKVHDQTGLVTTNLYGKNPVYGIDKSSFQLVFKRGAYMRRTRPKEAPNQHTVRHIHWDSWTQFRCFDRRRNFVITQTA